ncbi:S41 family peptidase [Flavivirga amylovorans]|uniref:S41 family peptidase n=1 Tax=Flavivirga amylovorans TaxID=870486 RepID=A0ABT8X2B5_9FLAO|nr:CDC27 family protein [Flavivirga amylovorans]MDO5988095.1 S41 family peptidase [Flavivirga amylovorans]
MKKVTITSFTLLIFFNISYTFSQTKNSDIESTTEYFHQRNEAVSLVKNKKWQESISILEKLTKDYENDPDLFYLLGLSYYQIEQYQNAITALKKTLDLGGTILRGIPTGSAPSNDIMIKIAKAYAKDNDKNNTILWLQKGFASRYDEKPFLKSSSTFKNFNEDEDFLELFGDNNQTDITREKTWTKDISYLEKRINELHYSPYHGISKTELSKEILKLKTNIVSLSDEQIIVELMKIIGSLGNGHNLIIPTSPNKGALKKLPVQFYQFNDGLFIVDAEKGFEQWIGYKVELIENTPIEIALQKTNSVNARDNDMQTLWLGPYYLGLPDVLKGLEIVKNSNQVILTLSDVKGKSQKVTMNPVVWSFSDFPKMPKLKDNEQPIFLSKTENPYWSKLIRENNSIYVQFNAVTQKKTQSLKDFNIELRSQISKNNTQNLILDLRHNHGGNGSILTPMLKTIINFEVMNPNGKIFVLIGRETFSAAQNLLTDITKYTNPIIVGEPSGSKPNHIGEAGWFKLPYSGLTGLISTQFHQTSKAEDNRKWIAPHIPVSLSSTDYFNGNDKAFNIILEVIKSNKN